MITEYVSSATHKAHYEVLPDDKLYYGETSEFKGVYATAETLEGCREELQAVLEDWLLSSIYKNFPIPVINNILLEVKHIAWRRSLRPIKRNDLMHYLRQLGFSVPYAGGKHQFMIR